jgi:hypothetical protein
MAVTFQEAVEAAKAKFPANDWALLTSGEQTAAVYREMRRLDAEAVRVVEGELKRRSA